MITSDDAVALREAWTWDSAPELVAEKLVKNGLLDRVVIHTITPEGRRALLEYETKHGVSPSPA